MLWTGLLVFFFNLGVCVSIVDRSTVSASGRLLVIPSGSANVASRVLFDYQGVWLNASWTPLMEGDLLKYGNVTLIWHCQSANRSMDHPHRLNVYTSTKGQHDATLTYVIDTSSALCGDALSYSIIGRDTFFTEETTFSLFKISEPNWAAFDAEKQNFLEFVSFSFVSVSRSLVRDEVPVVTRTTRTPEDVAVRASSVPRRRIEFLGDSLTAGYCNLCHQTDPSLPPGYMQESFAASWAHLTCTRFGAECHTEAWSGRGLVRNCCGNNGTLMPVIYSRALATAADQFVLPGSAAQVSNQWQFSSFVPDAIVINLGSNDFSGPDLNPAFNQSFYEGYEALLFFIKSVYAPFEPTIFLACGPVVALEGYCGDVLKLIGNRAVPNLHFLDHRKVLTPATTCCNHPDAHAHEVMAAIAISTIALVMGW